MRQDDFVNFMRATICKFEQSNSYGTAHIYKNSLSNLIAFIVPTGYHLRK